jgi:hypothetical protein
MTEIEQAEKIVRELEEKQEALIARTKVLAKQRQECSYAAHTGDKAARTKLDKINVEASTHAGEIESVDAALREAAARLNAAHAETDRAADRAAAEQLRDKLKQFKELGEVLDDCFADFRSAAIEQKKLLDEIHALGQAAPTHQQYRVLCEIALKTAVQQTPFWSQDFPAMAPNQRKSFRDVCNSWVEPIMHRVNALLGEQHKDAA